MSSGSHLPVSISNLTVSLGARAVVRLPELSLCAGETLQLCGSNGAGKTTLLRAVGGELPYTGEITLFGHAPGSVEARRVTAVVPTEATLLDDLTVAENLSFMAAAWSRPVYPLLTLAERLGLTVWLDDWSVTLSRGTRQKVALAAALGLELPVTLLDEPFATLDAASRAVLTETIQSRARAGGTVIVTTHGAELLEVTRRVLNLSATA